MSGDGTRRAAFVKVLAYSACAIVVVAGAAAFVLTRALVRERPPPPVHRAAVPKVSPSLYCVFSDFTHASAVAGFDFAVELPKGAPPRFAERAEALRDDPAVTFDENARPAWAYALDEDGVPTIASPDGATRIVLYGLKLDAKDAAWVEAGIRSNTIRNLDGKCLKSHFGDGRADAGGPASP